MGLEFSWSGMARWDFKALSTLGAERRQSRCSRKLGDVPAVPPLQKEQIADTIDHQNLENGGLLMSNCGKPIAIISHP